MRILAIDYGTKRTGLAVTDPLQLVACALETVPTHTVVDYILNYISREQVETVVVGEPKQLNGEPSRSMSGVRQLVNRLKKVLPAEVNIVMHDERFTSTLAHQAMLDGGMKKKNRRDKARVDSIAATIILNSYLDSQKYCLRSKNE